jgi:hypothetical protein
MAYTPSLTARSRYAHVHDPDEALDMCWDYDHGIGPDDDPDDYEEAEI